MPRPMVGSLSRVSWETLEVGPVLAELKMAELSAVTVTVSVIDSTAILKSTARSSPSRTVRSFFSTVRKPVSLAVTV